MNDLQARLHSRAVFLNACRNPSTEGLEIWFNFGHSSSRFFVEETVGRWRRRFRFLPNPCATGHELTAQMIFASLILHNFAIWEVLPHERSHERSGDHHNRLAIKMAHPYVGPLQLTETDPPDFLRALRGQAKDSRVQGEFDMSEQKLLQLAARNPVATTVSFQAAMINLTQKTSWSCSTRSRAKLPCLWIQWWQRN